MAKPLINYFNRDFETLKDDLLNYAKNYHSDKLKYFNSATPDYFYIQLMAYIGDALGYQLDKCFNEAYRESAQSREAIVRMAKDLMFYDYHAKPSTTKAKVSINVPYRLSDDKLIPDEKYLFTINSGMICNALNGTKFECLEDINFQNSNNRVIIPNYNANGVLVNFTVSKLITLYAGETKIQRYYVNAQSSRPFLEILVNDTEITEIIGIVEKAGNNYDIPKDSDFRNLLSENNFVEVKELFQTKIFVESPENNLSDSIVYGEWINKSKRFTVRRDKDNQTFIMFGSTLKDYSDWDLLLKQQNLTDLNTISLNEVLNNMSLGEVPKSDTTLFIQYRTGAGIKTNVPSFSINNIEYKELSTSSNAVSSVLTQVVNSLKIENELPAVGGLNSLTSEEIKQLAGKNFAANNRVVNYEDLKAIIQTMPSKFGTPFRISYETIKPKLLTYSYLQDYIKTQTEKIKASTNSVLRNSLIDDLNSWVSNYPITDALVDENGNTISLSKATNALNGAESITDNKLWYGEKCRLYVLGVDSNLIPITVYKNKNGEWQDPNKILKENIKNYLLTKRLTGDWIDIVDANVINFQVEFSIIADKKNKEKVLVECLNTLKEYFSVYNWQINQAIFKANVTSILQKIEGVLTVVDLKFYNVFGTNAQTGYEYSPKEIGVYKNNLPTPLNSQGNRFEMNSVNNIIVSYPSDFFHIKYPDADIIGKVIG